MTRPDPNGEWSGPWKTEEAAKAALHGNYHTAHELEEADDE